MELSSNLTLASVVSVQIQSCVTKFEDETNRRKKYTAFIIELRTHGGLVWTVERRFSQFYKLNQILKQRYDELRLFKFPQKRWFSSFATQTVEQRRRVFEVYLLELLSLQPRPVELNTFLDINSHIWGASSSSSSPGGGLGASSPSNGFLAGGAGGGAGGAGAMQRRSQGGGLLAPSGSSSSGSSASGGINSTASAEGLARLARGEVGPDDFELLKVLGKGSFGKVFLVRMLLTGQVYAMKVLKKSDVVRRRQVEHTKAERRIMGAIDHPFIVSLRFAFASADKLFLVTDYCRGGELFFHLKKFRTFPEAMVRFFAAELVCALGHLHSLDVVYRDLKPENVLLDAAGHVHLTDFGLSKDEVSDPRGATTFCGTPEYLAPEMLINRKSREGYGKAVDWWSLGTLLYEMSTGWPPFYDKNLRKMCENILKSDLAFPPGCPASPEARDLIRGLLMRDPAARLGSRAGGVDEIKAHPFFRGMDWVALEKLEVEPPFKPPTGSGSGGAGGGGEEGELDISNFDATFTNEPAELSPPDPSELADAMAASGSSSSSSSAAAAGGGGGMENGVNSSTIDEFSDFGFVNTTKLKSTLKAIFGLDTTSTTTTPTASSAGAGSAGAGRDDDEDDDDADGRGQAANGSGSSSEARVSHKDAPVTPELAAHLQRLAMEAGVAGAGVTEEEVA